VGDDASPTPAIAGLSTIPEAAEEYVKSPLSGVMASRTEFEMVGTLLGKRVEAEPTEATTESYSYDMPEALKVDFPSSLINTKKLIQKRWPILLDSHEARSPDKAIIVGEHGPLMTMPLFGVPSSHALTKPIPLFDSDKEIELYLERILTGVIV
jgi:hypothetical protein